MTPDGEWLALAGLVLTVAVPLVLLVAGVLAIIWLIRHW